MIACLPLNIACFTEYIESDGRKFELNSVIVVYNVPTWHSPTQLNPEKLKLEKFFFIVIKIKNKFLKIFFNLWACLAHPGPTLNKLKFKKSLKVTLKA